MVLGLYGASGHGTELYELAMTIDPFKKRWSEIIFIDDDPDKVGTCLMEIPIFSFETALFAYGTDGIEFIISIGEPKIKEIIYRKIKSNGGTLTQLIHPSVSVPSHAQLGEGLVAQKYSTIPPMANFGTNVLLQGYSAVSHGTVLGDNVVVSSFAFVGGDAVIGKNTYIAPHTCIKNGLCIGSDTVIGMGSVVTKDIPDGVIAYGQPCKVMRFNEKGRVFSK